MSTWTKKLLAIAALIVISAVAYWAGRMQGNGLPATTTMTGTAQEGTPAPENAISDATSRLEALVRQQQALSQQAKELGAATQQSMGSGGASAGNATSNSTSAANPQQQKMAALNKARTEALSEIMHARPGDTQALTAAIEKLDTQIRAAGLPSVIDMDKFRKMMAGSARIQELSNQLTAETGKGSKADPARIEELQRELARTQAEMPKTVYNVDALDKVMKGEH